MRADELRNGVARVLGPENRAAGTAFFVGPRLLVTCTHVLRDLGVAGPLDGMPVYLQALGSGPEKVIEARVDEWRDVDEGDITFLELIGPHVEGVRELPLGPSGSSAFHDYVAFGFPAPMEKGGMPGAGKIGTPTKRGTQEVRLLYESDQITWGFSGGPVFDSDARRVVGVVMLMLGPDAAGRLQRTAFMIPSETLRAIRPSLAVMPACPYLADRPFQEEDAPLFAGRKQWIDQIVGYASTA